MVTWNEDMHFTICTNLTSTEYALGEWLSSPAQRERGSWLRRGGLREGGRLLERGGVRASAHLGSAATTATSAIAGATAPFFQAGNDSVTFAVPAPPLSGPARGPGS